MKRELLVLLLAAACGAKPPTGSSLPEPGETHAPPVPGRPTAPGDGTTELPSSLPAARQKLAKALADGRSADVVVLANRVEVLGGSVDGPTRATVEAHVDQLSPAAVEDAWPRLEAARWPAPRVAWRRVALAAHRGNLKLAHDRLPSVGGDAGLARSAAQLVDELARVRKVNPNVIGVLLPLSGAHAGLGEEVRAALRLAASQEPSARLVFVDTGGDEARAAAAVDRLVADEHPSLLLGPIGRYESAAAAGRAAALGVPIALLSPTDGLADASSGIFRVVGSAEDRARAAARAGHARGFDSFAVFTPRDEAGRAQAAAFVQEAEKLGVRVVAQGEYDPFDVDLERDTKRFLGLVPSQNERLRRHLAQHPKDGWKTFLPDIDFDALFIPDGFEGVALIVSYLVYFNVELRTGEDMDSASLRRKYNGRVPNIVQLLGTSGWHDPGLVARGGSDVQGALIADVWEGGEGTGSVSDDAARFADAFQAATGRPPSSLAAEAFDGARLALRAHQRGIASGHTNGPQVRADVARALGGASLSDGVCGDGQARLGASGDLERPTVLFRVESDGFAVEDTVP